MTLRRLLNSTWFSITALVHAGLPIGQLGRPPESRGFKAHVGARRAPPSLALSSVSDLHPLNAIAGPTMHPIPRRVELDLLEESSMGDAKGHFV
jgi:hypothetical protein